MNGEAHGFPASLLVAAASTLLAAVLAVGLVVTIVSEDEPWRPLGPYPIQVVEAEQTLRIEGVDYPAVPLGGHVEVHAEKCFREDVAVSGSLSWFSIAPPGLSLITGGGARDRDRGCVQEVFTNPIPPSVEAWAQGQFDDGETYAIVRITGRDVATRVDGEESEPLTWRTQDFVLVPG